MIMRRERIYLNPVPREDIGNLNNRNPSSSSSTRDKVNGRRDFGEKLQGLLLGEILHHRNHRIFIFLTTHFHIPVFVLNCHAAGGHTSSVFLKIKINFHERIHHRLPA